MFTNLSTTDQWPSCLRNSTESLSWRGCPQSDFVVDAYPVVVLHLKAGASTSGFVIEYKSLARHLSFLVPWWATSTLHFVRRGSWNRGFVFLNHINVLNSLSRDSLTFQCSGTLPIVLPPAHSTWYTFTPSTDAFNCALASLYNSPSLNWVGSILAPKTNPMTSRIDRPPFLRRLTSDLTKPSLSMPKVKSKNVCSSLALNQCFTNSSFVFSCIHL